MKMKRHFEDVEVSCSICQYKTLIIQPRNYCMFELLLLVKKLNLSLICINFAQKKVPLLL